MLFLTEHRSRAARLSDYLPWAAMVAPGVILNKDGSFQRSARFRGPDLDSATQAELIAVSSRLNSALKRLGTGWAIYVEAQRRPSPGYPLSSGFADLLSALIDEERRDMFEGDGNEAQPNLTSAYYLTLQWLPPADDSARARSWFYEGGAEGVAAAADHLTDFERDTGRVLDMIGGVMPEAEWLTDNATLTYLHSTVSTHDQRIALPAVPMHVDALLADETLIGGTEPAARQRPFAQPEHHRFSRRDGAGNARRAQPAWLRLSLDDARDLSRQGFGTANADPHPPTVVRQAQEPCRDHQGGDDQRGECAGRQ